MAYEPTAKQLSKKKLGWMCRQYTDEAVDFMVAVLRAGAPAPEGAPKPRHAFVFEEQPTIAERLKAAEWLIDRGHGKAPQVVKVEEDRPVREYSDAELVAIIEASGLAQERESTHGPEVH